MNDLLAVGLTAVLSYLVGAVPFGYLIARARGVDLFKEGSGNIGATNAGRILGRRFGILVSLLDFAKGAGPVLAAKLAAGALPLALRGEELGVVAGLAAFLGHLFPVYLGFRGGKGVATGAGVVTVLLPPAAALGVVVWAGVLSATRTMSLASLAAAVTLVAVRLLATPAPFSRGNAVLTAFCFAAAALVVLRHAGNIDRLLRGTENRLQDTPTMQTATRVLHVLSLGLWFGMAVFFSLVVGVVLFGQIGELGATDSPHAAWFEVPKHFSRVDDEVKGRYEYTTRIAGHAIRPMFDWYFLLQGVCGFLALATAWSWQYAKPREKVHRRRVTVLLVALATVVLGWPLERHVSALRDVRHEKMDAYLLGAPDAAKAKAEAIAARAEFGLWHTVSLFLNFATLLLVAVGMALAAWLPRDCPAPAAKPNAVPAAVGEREA